MTKEEALNKWVREETERLKKKNEANLKKMRDNPYLVWQDYSKKK